MVRIEINNEALDLPAAFTLDVEVTNPIFNETGTQSLPATVPATPRNLRLLGFPTRLDASADPRQTARKCMVISGTLARSGTVNIVSASVKEGITLNIGFDNSVAYEAWQNRKLSDLSGLPEIKLYDRDIRDDVVHETMTRIYAGDYGHGEYEDLAVFPVVLAKPKVSEDEFGQVHYAYEMLNAPHLESMQQPQKVWRMIGNEYTEVNVPLNYGLSPFVRVWRVIELIFADLGVVLSSNPFKESLELSRLVVLNNAADACVTGTIRYKELLPDVTVTQFLNALWVRFGLVYAVDSDVRTVRLELLSEILAKTPVAEWGDRMAGYPMVNFEEPRYLKLSAKTSLEGAAPACERFEDFMKGLTLDGLYYGREIVKWKLNADTGDFDSEWPTYEDDPEVDPDDPGDWPEPDDPWDDPRGDWDDEVDGRGDDRDEARRTAAKASSGATRKERNILAYEVGTCMWHKLDRDNGQPVESSTSFFNWDPSPSGMETLELSSDDEFVPIQRIFYSLSGEAHMASFDGWCPMYLAGSRHFHTYIKGSEEEDVTETPLAFMFAFTNPDNFSGVCLGHRGTVGMFGPETVDGKRIRFGGKEHEVSLLFQFKGGLFDRYWRQYDELLRHGARTVELPVSFTPSQLPEVHPFDPVTVRGLKCIPDTFTYSLPLMPVEVVDMTMRPLTALGDYDIEAEQGVPPFEPGGRELVWYFYRDDIDTVIQSQVCRDAAVKFWKERNSDYVPPYDTDVRADYFWHAKMEPTWETDTSLVAPEGISQTKRVKYNLWIGYHIGEYYMDPDRVNPPDLQEHLGDVKIIAKYTVELKARYKQS